MSSCDTLGGMRRPNYVWDDRAQCFYYPSGVVAATVEQLYASDKSRAYWCVVGLCAGLAWMLYGTRPWFLARERLNR